MPNKADRLIANRPTFRQMVDGAIGEPEVKEVVVYQDNPNAIQRHDDGTMTYKRFTMTKIGLTVPDDATVEELLDVGDVIHGVHSSIQWVVGDWLNAIKRVHGETYLQVAEAYGYEVKTVQEWASVCRNISRRLEVLSFSHHQTVAPYTPDEQQKMLQWAIENRASVSALRKAITAWKNPPRQLELKLRFSEDVIESEHDSYTQLTRIRNAIKGEQSLTKDQVLADAFKLKAFAEKIIRDMGGE